MSQPSRGGRGGGGRNRGGGNRGSGGRRGGGGSNRNRNGRRGGRKGKGKGKRGGGRGGNGQHRRDGPPPVDAAAVDEIVLDPTQVTHELRIDFALQGLVVTPRGRVVPDADGAGRVLASLDDPSAAGGASPVPPATPNSGNHLLNFYFKEDPKASRPSVSPRRSGGGGGGGRSGFRSGRSSRNGGGDAYELPFHKARYVQTAFKLVLTDAADLSSYVGNADKIVDWDLVEAVIQRTHKPPRCPICLEPPTAAKITTCGHVFCYPCVIRTIETSERYPAPCPICFEDVEAVDLRPVSVEPVTRLEAGSTRTFRLLKRELTSIFSAPPNDWHVVVSSNPPTAQDPHARFCKYVVATAAASEERLDAELAELEAFHALLVSSREDESLPYVERAMGHLARRRLTWEHRFDSPEKLRAVLNRASHEARLRRFHASRREAFPTLPGGGSAVSGSGGDRENSGDAADHPALAVAMVGGDPSRSGPGGGRANAIAASDDDDDDDEGFVAALPDLSRPDGGWVDSDDETPAPGEHPAPAALNPQAAAFVPSFAVSGGDLPAAAPDLVPVGKKEGKAARRRQQTEPSPAGGEARNQRRRNNGDGGFIFFYQADDGQYAFLDPLNTRMLLAEFGDYADFPDSITASVREVEEMRHTTATRKRFKHLRHVPVTADVVVCYLELRGVVSANTMKRFKRDTKARLRRRQDQARREQRYEARLAKAKQRPTYVPSPMPPLSSSAAPPVVRPNGDGLTGPSFAQAAAASSQNIGPLSSPSTAINPGRDVPPTWEAISQFPTLSASPGGGAPGREGMVGSAAVPAPAEGTTPRFSDAVRGILPEPTVQTVQRKGGKNGSGAGDGGRTKQRVVLFSTGGGDRRR